MSIDIGGLRVPVSVIIPAAGSGKRVGGGTAKQFLPLRGEPVLVHTVRLFSESPLVDEIVIAAGDLETTRQLVGAFPKVTHIVPGGAERKDSVWAGLQVVHSRPRIVAVHDAARPLLPVDVLEGVLKAATEHQAQVVAVPVKDTVKVVSSEGIVSATLDRSTLWAVQTPQVFWVETLLQGYRKAQADNYTGTDDASVVERLGVPVRIYHGSHENIKLTTPEDFRVAEAILEGRK
ncbi:MAG: 2-C-methyl-D-erythritol 4-phosphate cytidylyltransferase [Bacillota bacterium]